MTVQRAVTRFLARRMNVPAEAIEMFRAANDFSGFSRSTLPTELIPLNTVTLARGLLNFTVIQTLDGWVLPFWAERQFNPVDPSFLPRAHGGLSINLSNRNWTALGDPSCDVEACVDPRGLLTPLPGRWSVDTWLQAGGTTLYPSRAPRCEQRLEDGLPVVVTTFAHEGLSLELVSFALGGTVRHTATVRNPGDRPRVCRLAFAVRPFNPEGVAVIRAVRYDDRLLTPGIGPGLRPDSEPDGLLLANHAAGDAAAIWMAGDGGADRAIHCEAGLAQACLWYAMEVQPGGAAGRSLSIALRPEARDATLSDLRQFWRGVQGEALQVETPDAGINELVRSSLRTLVLLCDGPGITPGPATYHQFWFRDAAYMLWALDKAGLHRYTAPVLGAFPARQERSGFFRSQQGEWDSNGQALWSVWQHTLFSGDTGPAGALARSMARGVEWIRKTRLRSDRSAPWFGLLPRGLSAEHLGHVDHYFWDNFWSVAGLEGLLHLEELGAYDGPSVRPLLAEYRDDLERAIARAAEMCGEPCIPAAPGRRADAGMIGSLCALYPLQLIPAEDPRVRGMLEILTSRCFVNGMFYQPFIHSGLNTYLTLQVAHAWLLAGDRRRFWEILRSVAGRAMPTGTYPEALHPLTGAGVMGDGHHGWTAAELVLALRDALVYERWSGTEHDLVLLAGVPGEWFEPGRQFSLERAPVPGGALGISSSAGERTVTISISWRGGGISPARRWLLEVPGGLSAPELILSPGSHEITLTRTGADRP